MPFISPMLAGAMPKKFTLDYEHYRIEEKYDGHRLIVETTTSSVRAWSRYGKERVLPVHLQKLYKILEPGIYDGELLVPGQRSFNVTELTNQEQLVFVVFDILVSFGHNLMHCDYKSRREMLEDSLELGVHWEGVSDIVKRAVSTPALNEERVQHYFKEVLAHGGEGLILKDTRSVYEPGKRPKGAWIKMKDQQSDVLKILGFVPGLNGPYSKVLLENDKGKRIQVKVRNNALLARASQNPKEFIGRMLRIEFQERTPDGSYRHPRWDRFEDE